MLSNIPQQNNDTSLPTFTNIPNTARNFSHFQCLQFTPLCPSYTSNYFKSHTNYTNVGTLAVRMMVKQHAILLQCSGTKSQKMQLVAKQLSVTTRQTRKQNTDLTVKTHCINMTLTYRHIIHNTKHIFNIVTHPLFQLASPKNLTLIKEHTITSYHSITKRG